MTLHGMMHGRGQEPLKDSGFRRASRNVIDARIGEYHRANRQNDQDDYETQDEFHFLLPTPLHAKRLVGSGRSAARWSSFA